MIIGKKDKARVAGLEAKAAAVRASVVKAADWARQQGLGIDEFADRIRTGSPDTTDLDIAFALYQAMLVRVSQQARALTHQLASQTETMDALRVELEQLRGQL